VLAKGANVLVVHPSLPLHSVKELIALAKQKPGDLQYASAGIGSFQHLGGELFKLMAGVDMLHAPFKGGGPAMVDIVGGHTKVMFSSMVQTVPQIKAGKLHAPGSGALERSPALPDVPTVAEASVPGYEAINWWGIVAPVHAVGDYRQGQPRGRSGATIARGTEAIRQRRSHAGFHEAGRVRRLHGERDDEMGKGRQPGRHQGRVSELSICNRPRHSSRPGQARISCGDAGDRPRV
jgi:hypothetical protein